MPDSERDRVRQLIDRKRARLHELRLQEATKGGSTEPHILIEIQETEAAVAQLEGQLSQLDAQGGQHAAVAARMLVSPLARYDDFFRRLFDSRNHWSQDHGHFVTNLLANLRAAARASNVFLVEHNGDAWRVVGARDDEAQAQATTLLAQDRQLYRFLDQTSSFAKETKVVNPFVHTNAMSARLSRDGALCVCVALPNERPSRVLVLHGIGLDFEVDIVFAATINAIFKATRNLKHPKSAVILESTILNTLKEQFGYVSDYMHEQQFNLFKNRLHKMTVYFEPIIALARTPYVWRWEALARDPETEPKRAPVDLFKTAELWGRMFQLELDIHFLNTALHLYTQSIARAEALKRGPAAARGEILPLSVNVYPESLVRRTYRELVASLDRENMFPLDKLVLEISEKLPLPVPDAPGAQADELLWFRDNLRHYSDVGISFAIDDFGVGFASTSRLSRIEPEFVKIDRDAILHHLGSFTLEYARRLVSESLGKMKMIVEGFDDQSKFSLAQLYNLKIRYVQGHLLGTARENLYSLSPEDERRIAHLLEG